MKPIALAISLIAAALLVAQSGTEVLPRPGGTPYSQQGGFGPILIPTTGTDICTASLGAACSSTRTIFITQITLSEESGSSDTCFIVDKQATPRAIYGTSAHPQTVSGTQIQTYMDRKAPNGVTWGCTTGTVTGYIRYEY